MLGVQNNQSRETVRRFIRLTNLIPEILEMVDQKRIAFNPAVELSYLTPEEQKNLLQAAVYKVLVSADDYRIIFNWHTCGGDEPPHPVCQSVTRNPC